MLNHVDPIIESSRSKNAHGRKLIFDYGIDAIAYDIDLEEGGQINNYLTEKTHKKQKIEQSSNEKYKFLKQKISLEVFISNEYSEWKILLCYPDERHDYDGTSLGLSYLHKCENTHISRSGQL